MPAAASRRKPLALRRLGDTVPLAFELLKKQYHVDDRFVIDLTEIAVEDPGIFRNPVEVAPLTMRKLQLLYHLSTSNEITTNHIVVQLLFDIYRPMAQLQSTVAENLSTSFSVILSRLNDAITEIDKINIEDEDLSPGDTVELY